MKGRRFTEEQIIGVLKESEAGPPTKEPYRRHGVSEQSFYRWKATYCGMDGSDAKKLRALEDENRRLKHIVAEQALDIVALKGVRGEKKGDAHLEADGGEPHGHGLPQEPVQELPAGKPSALERPVSVPAAWRRAASGEAPRAGSPPSSSRLPTSRDLPSPVSPPINHKRLPRLYRSEGLVLPRKRPKKRLWQRPRRLLPATRPNERWSTDFVQHRLGSGPRFRILTILDNYTREWKAAVVDTSIGGVRFVRLLEEIAESKGFRTVIVLDNGPEFTSRAFLSWDERRGIDLRFIRPRKLTQNAHAQSFNGKFRLECLDTHWFTTLEDARQVIETWRVDSNDVRAHSSLEDRTPPEFAAAHREAAA